MRRRTSERSSSPIFTTSCPSKRISPESAGMSPMSILSMTLFPEPDAPITVSVSPRRTSRLSPEKRTLGPNLFATFTNRTSGSLVTSFKACDRVRHVGLLEQPHLFVGQLHGECRNRIFEVPHLRRADDGCGHSFLPQEPG